MIGTAPAHGGSNSVASLGMRLVCLMAVLWLFGDRVVAQSATPTSQDPAIVQTQILPRVARRKAAAAKKHDAELPGSNATEATREKAARAPVVTLDDGILQVEANGAALNRIVDTIAAIGGTRVEGQVGDGETYGTYGPAVPGAVLTDLLSGSDQNVVMSGVNSRGAPMRLIVTPRNGGPSPPSKTAAPQEESEAQGSNAEALGPGAIANSPPPPPDDPKVRMQQTLDRLQKMQDQQKQSPAPQAPQ